MTGGESGMVVVIMPQGECHGQRVGREMPFGIRQMHSCHFASPSRDYRSGCTGLSETTMSARTRKRKRIRRLRTATATKRIMAVPTGRRKRDSDTIGTPPKHIGPPFLPKVNDNTHLYEPMGTSELPEDAISYCSCGGNSEDCPRCSGSGIIKNEPLPMLVGPAAQEKPTEFKDSRPDALVKIQERYESIGAVSPRKKPKGRGRRNHGSRRKL